MGIKLNLSKYIKVDRTTKENRSKHLDDTDGINSVESAFRRVLDIIYINEITKTRQTVKYN